MQQKFLDMKKKDIAASLLPRFQEDSYSCDYFDLSLLWKLYPGEPVGGAYKNS